MPLDLSTSSSLPRDAERATLVGRLWQPGVGPALVAVHEGGLHDLSKLAPTMSDLLAVVTRNRNDIEDIEEYVAREQSAPADDPTAPREAGS